MYVWHPQSSDDRDDSSFAVGPFCFVAYTFVVWEGALLAFPVDKIRRMAGFHSHVASSCTIRPLIIGPARVLGRSRNLCALTCKYKLIEGGPTFRL